MRGRPQKKKKKIVRGGFTQVGKLASNINAFCKNFFKTLVQGDAKIFMNKNGLKF